MTLFISFSDYVALATIVNGFYMAYILGKFAFGLNMPKELVDQFFRAMLVQMILLIIQMFSL